MFAFKKAERYSVCNSARATSRDFGAFWACQVCAAPFPLAEGKIVVNQSVSPQRVCADENISMPQPKLE